MSDTENHNLPHVSKAKATKIVDKFAYVMGVVGNIAVIPQIIKAWESDAPGLSILTWLLFTVIGIIWLVYAILHKQKPLAVAQGISIVCNLLVVIGWSFNNLIR
jgi:MtN3 and saliva related transmembrane protein